MIRDIPEVTSSLAIFAIFSEWLRIFEEINKKRQKNKEAKTYEVL
jgi:hypothetical protein